MPITGDTTNTVSSNQAQARCTRYNIMRRPSGTPVSSTNKIDHNDIDEILLKMALNTIILTPISNFDFNSTFL